MKKYWRSIEEYRQLGGEPGAFIIKERHDSPEEDPVLGSPSRRDFLKMLGFGLGYVTLVSSCEMPVRKAIPYLNQPEELVPGVANYYASTYFDGKDYASILVKSREGRPIKIEGNLMSALTKGGTHARIQASVLNLYDMARLKGPMKDQQPAEWEAIDPEIKSKLHEITASGKKIVLLSSTVISPSTRQLIAEFREKFPGTEWVVYDTLSAAAMLKANELNFGSAVIPGYRFDQADLIVGFNADFLGNWLSPTEYTKQYTRKRNLLDGQKTMSRHIQFESWMSLTGSNADYRVPIKPSEEGIVLMHLYNAIAAAKGAARYPCDPSPVDVDALAKQLQEHEGGSLLVSGTNDPDIQLTVNAINQLLGNYGKTIDLGRPLMVRQGMDDRMEALVADMNNDRVGALLIYQANPVFDYFEAEKFFGGMKKVALTISFSERLDETARFATYVCPDSNYLESWNDAEAAKGSYSTTQPVINRVFNSRQFQESLLRWMDREADFHSYMQKYWEGNLFGKQDKHPVFPVFWNQVVHDGVFDMSVTRTDQPIFRPVNLKVQSPTAGEGLELVLYEKTGIGDGRYANNPWLQELPDPITLSTWDNYACISPRYAEEHGLKNEDVVKVGGMIELPVLVQPGQPDGTVAIAIGYGRTSTGKVANGIGKNAYPFMHYQEGFRKMAGRKVSLESIEGKTYPLALTQMHHTMEGRAIVREATLAEYLAKPESGNEMHMDIVKQNLTLYEIPTFPGYHWGMAINLNSCIGCGNCVISCQAENNTPVIGKAEVGKHRIMHWMRIDRYYSSDASNPEVVHMPVMCQHCDNAPCENVCPVAATSHSSEGLNQMAYNRCIGTKYCINNCPYKVRRFNWFEFYNNEKFDYHLNDPLGKLVLNPDVVTRSRGVVEKCTFCVQRIQDSKLKAKLENRPIADGELKTACQQSCPGDAIIFGDMNDPNSQVSQLKENPRTYQLLEQLHVLPSVNYMTRIRNKETADKAVNYPRTPYEPKHKIHKDQPSS